MKLDDDIRVKALAMVEAFDGDHPVGESLDRLGEAIGAALQAERNRWTGGLADAESVPVERAVARLRLRMAQLSADAAVARVRELEASEAKLRDQLEWAKRPRLEPAGGDHD